MQKIYAMGGDGGEGNTNMTVLKNHLSSVEYKMTAVFIFIIYKE
jgi:hypothetical protein